MQHIWKTVDGWYTGRMPRETYRGRLFRQLFEERNPRDCLHRRETFEEIAAVACSCTGAARGVIETNPIGAHYVYRSGLFR